jgi:hypothetical protein
MRCTISAYHYNLVCYLCLIASSSYFTTALATYKHTDSRLRGCVQLGLTLGTLVPTIILHYKKLIQTKIFPTFRPHEMSSGNRTSTGLVLPAACFQQYPGAADLSGNLANFTGSDRWTKSNSTIMNSTEPHLKNFVKFGSNDDLGQAFDIASSLLISMAGLILSMWFVVETGLLKNCCNRDDREQEDRLGSSSSIFKSSGLHWVRAVYWLISFAQRLMGTIRFKLLQAWMILSNWFGDAGEVELETSYGQFMPLLLLIVPVMGIIGALIGTWTFHIGVTDCQLPARIPYRA